MGVPKELPTERATKRCTTSNKGVRRQQLRRPSGDACTPKSPRAAAVQAPCRLRSRGRSNVRLLIHQDRDRRCPLLYGLGADALRHRRVCLHPMRA